jgi:hypothetical protein
LAVCLLVSDATSGFGFLLVGIMASIVRYIYKAATCVVTGGLIAAVFSFE